MKVQELIEELQKYDGDRPIVISSDGVWSKDHEVELETYDDDPEVFIISYPVL